MDPVLFGHHAHQISDLIQNELNPPLRVRNGNLQPNVQLEALMCLTYLLKNHPSKVVESFGMYNLINDIFFSGFNDEVI